MGTFLGILMSYGFLGPLAVKLESLGTAEAAFFRTIAVSVEGFVNELAPKVVLDHARRGVASEFRPTREEMEQLFKQVEAS